MGFSVDDTSFSVVGMGFSIDTEIDSTASAPMEWCFNIRLPHRRQHRRRVGWWSGTGNTILDRSLKHPLTRQITAARLILQGCWQSAARS